MPMLVLLIMAVAYKFPIIFRLALMLISGWGTTKSILQ